MQGVTLAPALEATSSVDDSGPPTLSDSIMQLVKENQKKLIDNNEKIALMCYGDHDISIFWYFITHIIPDGEHLSLARLIYDDLTEEKKSKVRFKNLLTIKDRDDLIPDSPWRRNIRFMLGCICIQVKLGGVDYVVAETFSRQDYNKLAGFLDGSGYKDGWFNKKPHPRWAVHHSVHVTHYLKNHSSLDSQMHDFTHDKYNTLLWQPGGMRDLMVAAYITHDGARYSLWNALMPSDYSDSESSDVSDSSSE
jgi:hypothetical protein